MLGASVRFGHGNGENRFYCPPKARKNYQHQNERNRNRTGVANGKIVVSGDHEPENRARDEEISRPLASTASDAVGLSPISNLEHFLESTTPSVPAQYLSKTTVRGWRTCDVEFRPFFALLDLWESFKEWSAYGAGVPLVLNDRDSVVQYYVPYLSGIQLYGESTRQLVVPRSPCEDSDADCYRDSSSDGSSDCELERGPTYPSEWSQSHAVRASTLMIDGLSLRDMHARSLEGFSSDDSEAGNSQGRLLFEYFERDIPYGRVPLADKFSELACHFSGLKTLRSCDLLPTSWMSVAWYPIYRIPTGPTLRDLDACFLTFHSLSMPLGDAGRSLGPIVTYPQEAEGVPEISIPVFGMASYKLKGSIWAPNEGCNRQLGNSLLQAADNWLQLLHVNHPDYQFFVSRGTFRR